MALQKNKVDIYINGEKLTYYITSSEAAIYAKAESLIEKKIEEYNKYENVKAASATIFLKAILVSFVVDGLKKEIEKEEIIRGLEEINSQLENYLNQLK